MFKIIFVVLLLIATTVNAQFKADNVKYTTVFPEELCKTLMANQGYMVLDVRSDGEFYDTLSMSEGLNLGHIKDAKHIDIRHHFIRDDVKNHVYEINWISTKYQLADIFTKGLSQLQYAYLCDRILNSYVHE